ncbi:hypothetical protein CISG_08722 [Coccidioides immitis RMSCC 3703]|uniref:Phosphoglycerate mutase family protein n=1 Tax=Coccidioides immitis RMSCC 3703 TaxID=454286 RepID=A0A0J8R8T8_COCIT|nr:hypothetical protein CISG_08722 [Coccidioides immitis RMSCC 3703]
MGKAPAVTFVVRHGARLDAVDKHWHLTSPTPYDPPLTYGGWNQSRMLGIRIESLLREREQTQSSSDTLTESPAQRTTPRKQKIIIHCSPFLRCVQTAIAISAGISQAKGSALAIQPSSPGSNPFGSTTTQGRSTDDALDLGEGHADKANKDPTTTSKERNRHCILRLDAFLGEWLTPDYFEQIPPPPGSVMMVASAKADLLRPAEAIELSSPADLASASGFFPGGWKRSSTNSFDGSTSFGASQSIPTRTRSGTLDGPSGGLNASRRPVLSKLSTALPNQHGGYVPPTPTYAVKPSDAIPRGYVAHARDACVEVDYQWDSMREPQSWGTGGEYGEEWSSMHRRFRDGLERMISWYKCNGSAYIKDPMIPESHDDGNDDVETIVILVTHGAGCNALKGALTNRPALLDIGISSLTMAVRKAEAPGGSFPQPDGAYSQVNLADEYDVSILASTDHLRAANSTAALGPASSRGFPSSDYSHRQRFSSTSSSTSSRGSLPLGDSSNRTLNYPKLSSQRPPSRSAFASRLSSGLWGSVSSPDPADDLIPNFGDCKGPESLSKDPKSQTVTVNVPIQSSIPAVPQTSHGLWSKAPERESQGKRRWTVTDR